MNHEQDEPEEPGVLDILEEDDDEADWDVIVPALGQDPSLDQQVAVPETPLEITLETTPQSAAPSKKAGTSSKDAQEAYRMRLIRVQAHQIHTVCLLKSFSIRNSWINDPLLHARLVSITPLGLQNSFAMITKQRIPDQPRRGRLFEATLMRLTEWWKDYFAIDADKHIRSMTFEEALSSEGQALEGETLKSVKSLMKHALNGHGSRDTSAILFTALCRGLNIPARLVVSLQSVPWKASDSSKATGASKKKDVKGKGKAPQTPIQLESSEDDLEPIVVSNASAKQIPSSSTQSKKRRVRRTPILKKAPPVHGWPPTIWTEVFSRPDSRWLPVDPIRYIVNKRKLMEPPPYDKENRMTYVVAFEEDGYVKDVTPRYARDYWAKTLKKRAGTKSGRQEWWSSVLSPLTRPYRLQRDNIEDDELRIAQQIEGMPTSVAAFKDHPVYVLERHLKQNEVIYPKEEIGTFRGEPVFSRSNVLPLKSAETWTRLGRRVKEGCQPLKMVKQRAVTLNRKRALELTRVDGEEPLQGLYAEEQTELYVPDPVIDGRVPKNEFGNLDLYTPSMLPSGATHIPYKGVAKIARALQIDYAEAVTGFEYRKGRALPVITGIVVASENEEVLVEAYWESSRNEEAKQRQQRRERVLKRWTKLVQGLRIRERMQIDYGTEDRTLEADSAKSVDKGQPSGGFLTEADTIVQPYSLPKPTIAVTETFVDKGLKTRVAIGSAQSRAGPSSPEQHDDIAFDENIYRETAFIEPDIAPRTNDEPITMQALAELAANGRPNIQEATDVANASNTERGRLTRLSSKVTTGRPARTKRTRPSAESSNTPTRVLRPRAAPSEAEKRKRLEEEEAIEEAMEE